MAGVVRPRFLTPGMAVALAAYLLVALTYVQVHIKADGVAYYRFLRRMLGENEPHARAYQFGVALWNAPFYLAGRALEVVTGPEIGRHTVGELSIVVAANVAVLGVFYVLWRLLSELDLDGAPGALLITVFGTPLFYYAIYQPSYSHAADALFTSLLTLLLLKASIGGSDMLAVAVGVTLAVLVHVRYANVALLTAVLIVLAGRRSWRHLIVALGTATLVALALFGLPLVRGIPYDFGSGAVAGPGATPIWGAKPDLLAPLKMLFTIKRGLFIWTPFTLLAVVGFGLLVHRLRTHRLFLASLGAAALSLLIGYAAIGSLWTGGMSFSQRFLTGLVPVFALGTAELLRRFGPIAAVVLTACVIWTFSLALYHGLGYPGQSQDDGLFRLIKVYRDQDGSPAGLLRSRYAYRIRERWTIYFDFVRGKPEARRGARDARPRVRVVRP
jgi:hypothetical protein